MTDLQNIPQDQTHIGNYELLAVIGRGGMGTVYKARQLNLDRIVALKMISNAPIASEEQRVRFQAEAKTTARLKHPGIVSVHDSGEQDGQPYYTMDFVDGPTLAKCLEQSTLAPQDAAILLVHIADAVAHAHEHHVLHRDLKPSNILLDRDGRPRVADFGLAKCLLDNLDLTKSGEVLGTPHYMSPEQASGELDKIGPGSDVYSLGAILYATLTGSPPFSTHNEANVLRCVIEELPEPPRKRNPDIPRDLETICLKCLEKPITNRYENVIAFAADLRQYINGEPIKARPRSRTHVVAHWCRRPERIGQAAGVILLIALFYGMWATMGTCSLVFGWVQPTEPTNAAMIVVLDTLGFLACLPVGLGVLAHKRWMMQLGLWVGLGMTAVIFALMISGFDAGGLLADPFARLSIYAIFGFVGCTMVGACIIALMAHKARRFHVEATRKTRPGSTTPVNAFATTIDFDPR